MSVPDLAVSTTDVTITGDGSDTLYSDTRQSNKHLKDEGNFSIELDSFENVDLPLMDDSKSITSMDAVLETSNDELNSSGPKSSGGPTEQDLNPDLAAFMTASQGGDLALISELISTKRVTANDSFTDGVTALHWACINNQLAIVEYLITNPYSQADPNIRGGDLNATPLHWACRQGLIYIVDYLMRHSTADPTLRDSQSYNALHLAVHTSNPIMVIYLLITCTSEKSPKLMYVDEPDGSHRTPLHWAAYQGDSITIGVLLKYGADVTKVDDTLFIPIHWAFMAGNRAALKELLRAGSDIQFKNSHGKNTFDIAADMNCLDLWHRVLLQDDRSARTNWEKRNHWISPRAGKVATFIVPYIMLPTMLYTCSFSEGYGVVKLIVALAEGVVFVKLTDILIIPIYLIDESALAKSPFLAGVFSSTAFWGIVLWLVRVLPATFLSRFFGNMAMAIATTIFVWTYYKTLFINPGNVPTPSDNAVRMAQVEELLEARELDTYHFCPHTLVRKPLRSKYSRVTLQLVARFDHYCPWAYNDIGVRNHKLFMTFVYSLAIAIVLFCKLSLHYFKKLEDGADSDNEIECAFLNDELCFAYRNDHFHFNFLIWCMFQLLWLSFLCIVQTFQIFKGVTTYEFSKLGHSTQDPRIKNGHGHRHGNGFKTILAMLGIDQLIHTIKVAAVTVVSKVAPGSRFAATHTYDALENIHIPSDFGLVQNITDFWVLGDVKLRNIFFLPIEGENNLNGQLVDYYKLYQWPVKACDVV